MYTFASVSTELDAPLTTDACVPAGPVFASVEIGAASESTTIWNDPRDVVDPSILGAEPDSNANRGGAGIMSVIPIIVIGRATANVVLGDVLLAFPAAGLDAPLLGRVARYVLPF